MRAADSRGHAWRNAGRTALLRHGSATGPRPTLCCRIVLMALCVTCSFAPAWAATFVAAKAARVPHGRKAACIHGRPACAFVRQSRPKAPLREPFLPLLAPLHAALPCGGGSSLHTPLTRRASGGQGCFQHYSTTERMMALCCGTVLEVSSPPEHFTHEKLCRVTRSGIMPRRPFSGVAAIYLRR